MDMGRYHKALRNQMLDYYYYYRALREKLDDPLIDTREKQVQINEMQAWISSNSSSWASHCIGDVLSVSN